MICSYTIYNQMSNKRKEISKNPKIHTNPPADLVKI